jgi:hypothetical protein
MADSDIQVTAGTGPKVDTRTVGAGTDEHRQVMVIGDPSTATDVATVTASNGLKVDVTRVTGSVTIGDGTQNIAIDSAQSDAESNGVNSLHTSSRNYVFNGTTWDRNRGDITNGLDVDVTRIIPGVASNNLGKQEDQLHQDGDTGVLMLGVRNHLTGSTVDGEYSAISVSSTGEMQTVARRDLVRLQQAISFTGNPPAAYVSGDQFGNLVTLTNAARVSGGTGTITGLTINTASVLTGAFDVLFFDSSVTLAGDSSPFSISDADGLKLIGIAPLAGSYSLGLNRVSQAFNLAIPYVCVGSTSLFAAIITRNPFTLVSGDFASNLNVFVERN